MSFGTLKRLLRRRPHDWELIATAEPYFSVVSAPNYRMEKMGDNQQARKAFYASGRADVEQILEWCQADCGRTPGGGRALDIGCGVGRMTYAMTPFADEVVGYDLSEPMLDIARRGPPGGAPGNVTFGSRVPSGSFDWISSYIVFQHIPPSEGLRLLSACLAQAADGAFATVHVTAWREQNLSPRRGPRMRLGSRLAAYKARRGSAPVETLIKMYDYNLSHVLRAFVEADFSTVRLRHTNHGGHHGVWVIARKGDG